MGMSKKSGYMAKEGIYYCQVCGKQTIGKPNIVGSGHYHAERKNAKVLKLCLQCLTSYHNQQSDCYQKVTVLIASL